MLHFLTRVGPFAVTTFVALAAIGCGGGTATTGPASSLGTTPAGASPAAATNAATPSPGGAVIELPTQLPAHPTYEQLLPLFAYHSATPFDVKENGSHDEGGVTVRDISYAGEAGQLVDAYLVVPPGDGPFPAVLFEHGMGDTRDQYIDLAVALAGQQHVVGLVPTRPVTASAGGTDEAILQIREMRHGLDLLVAQPGVDGSRLGYVGFSMGAVLGSEIVAVESRLKTAVLMEAVPNVARNWLDPAVLAPHAATTDILFQFGKSDPNYGEDEANAFAALYPQKQVSWYDQPHSISTEFATDCEKWLSTNL
jgi:dienelactone hydrolase